MATTHTSANEQMLRETAYLIWEEAGRPFGQAEVHWQMAKEITRAAEIPAQQSVAPKSASRKKRAGAETTGSSAKITGTRKGASNPATGANNLYQ